MRLIRYDCSSGRPNEAKIDVKDVASFKAAYDIVRRDPALVSETYNVFDDMREFGPGFIVQHDRDVDWNGNTALIATNGDPVFFYLVK